MFLLFKATPSYEVPRRQLLLLKIHFLNLKPRSIFIENIKFWAIYRVLKHSWSPCRVLSNTWILQSLVGFSRQWNCTNLVKITFHGWKSTLFLENDQPFIFCLRPSHLWKTTTTHFGLVQVLMIADCKLGLFEIFSWSCITFFK